MNMAISQKNAEKPFNPTKHEANLKINEQLFIESLETNPKTLPTLPLASGIIPNPSSPFSPTEILQKNSFGALLQLQDMENPTTIAESSEATHLQSSTSIPQGLFSYKEMTISRAREEKNANPRTLQTDKLGPTITGLKDIENFKDAKSPFPTRKPETRTPTSRLMKSKRIPYIYMMF